MPLHCRSLAAAIAVVLLIPLSASRAEAPAKIQTPPLSKHSPVELNGKKNKKLEFFLIEKSSSIVCKQCSGIIIHCCDVHSIRLEGCTDITIQNSWIHDSSGNGISASNCKGVTIQGCRIENVATALYALEGSGLKFAGNYVQNMKGPMPRGQMVQFDKVKGAGNVIRDNYCVNFQGRSKPEDAISIFHSEGAPESPILIENNYITGDPATGSEGKSGSGSGMMLGDGGGRNILARGNILISPGQAGIGVAGGESIRVENNVVIGSKSAVSNVGIYAWNQSGKEGGRVEVVANRVFWINNKGLQNSWWKGSGFAEVEMRDNHFADKTLQDALPSPPTRAPMPPLPVATKGTFGSAIQLPWN